MKLTKLITTSAIILTALSTASVALAADGGVYESNGSIEFVPFDGITPPVDPENPDPNKPVQPIDPTNPDEKPNPGTAGPLSIDYASSLDFGKNKITNRDETYHANAVKLSDGRFVSNYVQISDNRGSNAGWSLTVKQEGQLKNETAMNKELTGSVIKLVSPVAASVSEGILAPKVENITLDPTGEASMVMNAADGAGAGTWVDRFGTVEEVKEGTETVQKNKAITLEIPGKTPKDAVKYTTKLTWTLTDTPANN